MATTAFRLIHTLEEEGFLRRVPDTDRLLVGPDLMRIAREAVSGSRVLVMALPHLERLTGGWARGSSSSASIANGRPALTLASLSRLLVLDLPYA